MRYILPIILLATTACSTKEFLSGFAEKQDTTVSTQARPSLAAPSVQNVSANYMLGAGDKIKLRVDDEESLSDEYEIDGQGQISFPLIGTVQCGGKTPRQLENAIRKKLADGYILNPRVSIEVLNYRPFYILGEVNNPGSYPYVNGMTAFNAIALAGGYTYRADEDFVELKRGNSAKKRVPLTIQVLPGDILTVDERFF